MFILKKGHQPGVYVPLRALFLVFQCNIEYVIHIPALYGFFLWDDKFYLFMFDIISTFTVVLKVYFLFTVSFYMILYMYNQPLLCYHIV